MLGVGGSSQFHNSIQDTKVIKFQSNSGSPHLRLWGQAAKRHNIDEAEQAVDEDAVFVITNTLEEKR